MSDIELLQVDHIDWPNAVISAALATPPGSPSTGDRYVVAASPTGAWSGHATHVARWSGSAWEFQTPTAGRAAWNAATSSRIMFDGSAWVAFGSTSFQAAYDGGPTITMSGSDIVISKNSAEILRLGSTALLKAVDSLTPGANGNATQILGGRGGAAAIAGLPGDGGSLTLKAGSMGSEALAPGGGTGGVMTSNLILEGGDTGDVGNTKAGNVLINGGTPHVGGTPVPGDVRIGQDVNKTHTIRSGQSSSGTPWEHIGPLWTPLVTLTDGATVTVPTAKGCQFKVTIAGNRTLDFSFPTSYSNSIVSPNGISGLLIVQQDATGGRTLSFAAKVKTSGDVTADATASAVTLYYYTVEDATHVHLRKLLASTAGGVTSFNSRTGAVTPQTGDYTATNVGLGSVTNDAQLKRAAGDFSSFTAKASPVSADVGLLEDSAASGAKKSFTLGSQAVGGDSSGTLSSMVNTLARGLRETSGPTTLAMGGVADLTLLFRSGTDLIGRLISAFTTKATPVSADLVLLGDSAASGALKSASLSSLAAAIAAGGSSIIVAKNGTDIGTRGRINVIEGSNVTLTVSDNSGAGRVDVTVAASGSGSSTGSSPLYTRPTSPGTLDEEFDGATTLPGGWIYYDATNNSNRTPSGAVDLYTQLTGSATVPRQSIHTDRRASWLTFQVTDSGVSTLVVKTFTPSTNAVYWGRFRSNHVQGSMNSPAGQMQLGLWGQVSGHPDSSNRVLIGYVNSSATVLLSSISTQGGVNTGPVTAGSGLQASNAPLEYFAIEKRGTSYYTYAFSENGFWICLGKNVSNTLTPVYIGVDARAGDTSLPVQAYAIDFIRETTSLPF